MSEELFSRLSAIGTIIGGGTPDFELPSFNEPDENTTGDLDTSPQPAAPVNGFTGGTMTEARTPSGGETAGARALQNHLLGKFTDASTDGGIYNNRNVRGGTSLSVHAEGRAGDILVPVVAGGHSTGNTVATYLEQNADRFGVQRIIWNGRSWNRRTRRWVPYRGVNPHRDHVHWEITPEAAARPELYGGDGAPAPAGRAKGAGPSADPVDLFSRVKSVGDIIAGKPAGMVAKNRTNAGLSDLSADMAKTFAKARKGGNPGGMGAPSDVPVASGEKGEYQQYAIAQFAQYGWGSSEAGALIELVQRESGWNPNARNPTSSASGLFQKITTLHGPLEKTWQDQIRWGLDYIKRRYGSPSAALAHWKRRVPINGRDVGHWY